MVAAGDRRMRLHRIIFCNETVACVQRQTPLKGLPDSEACQTATGSRWALWKALHKAEEFAFRKRSGRPLGSVSCRCAVRATKVR